MRSQRNAQGFRSKRGASLNLTHSAEVLDSAKESEASPRWAPASSAAAASPDRPPCAQVTTRSDNGINDVKKRS